MTRELLTGNGAAAWGARLAHADYVPAFPITPQTEIIETLAGWFDSGEMPGRLVTLDIPDISEPPIFRKPEACKKARLGTFAAV